MLPALQNHRGRSAEVKGGDAEAAKSLEAIAADLEVRLRSVEGQTAALRGFSVDSKWQSLKRDVEALLADDAKLSVDQSFERHSVLINRVGSLMSDVASDSGLVLDPDTGTYHLVIAGVLNAPELANHMAYTRRLGALMLQRNTFDQNTKLDLAFNVAKAEQHMEMIGTEFSAAVRYAPEIAAQLEPAVRSLEAGVQSAGSLVKQRILLAPKADYDNKLFYKEVSTSVDSAYGFYYNLAEVIEKLLRERVGMLSAQAYALLAITLLIFIFGIAMAALFVRDTLRSVRLAVARFRDIASGNFRGEIRTSTKDEIGQLLNGLKLMQIKLGFDINESRERAERALRIKIGLDSVNTNVMIADNERTIIYLNPSVIEMLRVAQSDIRKDLPHFDVDRLLGTKIDVFHKNPDHQSRLLATFSNTFRSQVTIGGRIFSLTANPVIDESGARLGSVVEWNDRTSEVAVEKEVNGIVAAAAAGDFSQRCEVTGKAGFLQSLSSGINQVVSTCDASLKDIARVLRALAKGDLTERIEANYQGTFAELKDYTNETVQSLERMLRQIRESSETIHMASSEIASGNTDLSARTEEQAASLEETASSMEELTSTVKQNAQNARQANSLAESTSSVATRTGEVVGEVVSTMGAINDSARKIVDIIGVIDGIAFQTNILALNAAVEAARAGEQGRGFAVVAGEVRNLAQRSAAAAKEIKGLISDSVEKAESGNRLVDSAGKTMEEVVASIRRLTDMVNEISAASVEQSNGIEQVSVAVNQMDETTQQNAALVEQAAASAESLSGQAASLLQVVRRFKLRADETESAAPGKESLAVAGPKAPPSLPSSQKGGGRPAPKVTIQRLAKGQEEEGECMAEADGEPIRYFDHRLNQQAVKIMPGEYYVTSRELVIVTVLGSCVSACIYDRTAGVGGMNHFMLPVDLDPYLLAGSARYGSYAMEILINQLLKAGARRDRLEAKVFGGGRMFACQRHQSDIGTRNAVFVLDYLARENIVMRASDLLGDWPRKLYFMPTQGRVIVKTLKSLHNDTIFRREQAYEETLEKMKVGGGVDLF
ncbi:MAG: hypothetical protein CGU29_05945 [Candidatus Dactylopiibacterium carminicum]|uniref:Probable chemoreceptor glutamine deamidase CheD n=1 Tax=Candidatus Dactylopiibacterium carminicum TaxID=857335 RepID=A0A272EUK6_9RHOO|nr:hypothetical protein BGI27_03175 [Candidatus Dactylopiibacterium carminicum]PAS93777.1 MAG: hypothetical protein CGU29_05945 [Candidatus Dactylopiibacterium carminicum]PAT00394.1 MAG: hypothetical protein BSR46_03195 [Candidatus Dactylopiibacterium carminicum]